jgi:hypothetical protein
LYFEGHAVKRLTKHSDEKVAHLAKLVVRGWQSHFETKLSHPAVDVQCDRKTESLRQTARKQIVSALLSDKAEDEPVSLHTE